MRKCPNCGKVLIESTFLFTGRGVVYECNHCLALGDRQCRFDPCEVSE